MVVVPSIVPMMIGVRMPLVHAPGRVLRSWLWSGRRRAIHDDLPVGTTEEWAQYV